MENNEKGSEMTTDEALERFSKEKIDKRSSVSSSDISKDIEVPAKKSNFKPIS